MWPCLAADALAVLHLGFVLFVIFGGMLAWRWRWSVWLHLPAALWGIGIEWSGAICPLTDWETALRLRGGQAGYSGGFVEHYLLPVLYPAALTRTLQWTLGAVVLVVNLLVYWRWWRLRRRAHLTAEGHHHRQRARV